MRLFALFAAGAILAGSAASAATVNYHFGYGSQSYGSSGGYYTDLIEQTVGGVDVDVTGIRCDDGAGPNDSSCGATGGLYEWDNGIGIKKVGTSDGHWVDGLYSNEFVKLTFDNAMTLTSAAFSYFGSSDKFWLYTWNGTDWTEEGVYGDGSYSYSFAGDYTSTMFLFGARYDHDTWKFKGAGFEHVAPVPLPAAGFLLLGALGGLAAFKRRNRS